MIQHKMATMEKGADSPVARTPRQSSVLYDSNLLSAGYSESEQHQYGPACDVEVAVRSDQDRPDHP